ncbi:hypothetical protein QO034_21035 [Sedimentitalea sp. JM2-8]|uniref:TolB amino-terminal domain-containing protein n=1 Tax=Sedimentitalea xiamensis TaxID=3050037 RepID=A0ABT7FK67_9RHOB|nr:hypothetical protein [Sedimentitalea xiamensis]MDK3075556.1 hypothetical protein [Sedimentitalea xiamensis]
MPRRNADSPELIDDIEVRRQLERILGFSQLQANARRREMLAFIVDEALAGRASELKATTIAMAVFDRGADFDQQSDPIVRLEARKLRRDLDNYYAGPGRTDPVRIEVPKGHYRPKFSRQLALDHEHGATMPTEADAADPAAPEIADAPRVKKLPIPFVALVAIGVVALVGSVLFWVMQPDDEDHSYTDLPFRGASILVQPFETANRDAEATLVARLLAQDITGALLKFPDIRAHTTLETGENETEGATAVPLPGRTLYTVHGIVWREENQMFVRAELSRNEDEEVLWSERYSESDGERGISGISDEISSQVAAAIGQQYGVVRSETRDRLLAETSDPSLTSYACIARATEYRRIQSRDLYWDTRNCLEETVQRQPEFSRGWAMLAYLRFDAARFNYEENLTREEGYAQAREAAAHALTLNPRDTDALKAMSHILHFEGDLEQSIDYARRAVETNPNDPETVGNLGVMLGYQGRFSEAKPSLEFAIERSISPAPRYFMFMAMAHMMNEGWDEMLSAATYSAADGSSISYMLLAIANANLGNVSAARTDYLRLAERWPLLAEDPRAALRIYNVDTALVDAFVAGLDRVRAVVSQ